MINTYWLTFRIAENQRRDALYDAVRNIGDREAWWTEPTSFIVFKSELGIDEVAAAVAAVIDVSIDVILVGMPEFRDGRTVGRVDDSDIYKLIPFVSAA